MINLTSPKMSGWTVGAFLNAVQGNRFSALTTPYDISGTDICERRGYTAFIFDPDDPTTAELQGQQFVNDMNYVLENAHPNAVEYLKDNFGRYARANAGIQPWRTQLDVRVSNELSFGEYGSLILSLGAFNMLNLINSLWRDYSNIFESQDLYSIEGFTQDSRLPITNNKFLNKYLTGRGRFETRSFLPATCSIRRTF